MPTPQAFDDLLGTTPAAKALALKLVTEADLLRLKVIARLHARGLPPQIGWSDLLQEAFARVLEGARRRPDDVPLVAFLAGVMRSIKAEHWRRARREATQLPKLLAELDAADSRVDEARDPRPDPECSLVAMQELEQINQLFADDARALQVILGLAEGRSTAARELGMNPSMKGSAAFFGVTRSAAPRSWPQKTGEQKSAPRSPGRAKGDGKPSDTTREQIHSWLAALTPQEAKVLRARFEIDGMGQTSDEEEAILRALARDLAMSQKKQ